MQMLQNMKAWVEEEVRGAHHWLSKAVKEMWWAVVLAAGMVYFGGLSLRHV